MSHSIYSIVERLRELEESLDIDQRRAGQLSATFRPRTVAVLTAPDNPPNPMGGQLVGGCEESIQETEVVEDKIDAAGRTLADYLASAEQRYRDSHLSKKPTSREISEPAKPRDLVASAVKTIRNECGVWQVHGSLEEGFAVSHGNNQLPRRFRTLDEAEMALELFNHRRRRQQMAQDYIDEA